MENKDLLRKQENMYWNATYDDKIWYRKIYGGQWRLLKLGKDTPYIGMFCTWTKMGDECWSGYKEVLKTENYPITGVDTKFKFYKELFKNIYKRFFIRK
jgi:hypothetical protein